MTLSLATLAEGQRIETNLEQDDIIEHLDCYGSPSFVARRSTSATYRRGEGESLRFDAHH
jgi:hypothetical protein